MWDPEESKGIGFVISNSLGKALSSGGCGAGKRVRLGQVEAVGVGHAVEAWQSEGPRKRVET